MKLLISKLCNFFLTIIQSESEDEGSLFDSEQQRQCNKDELFNKTENSEFKSITYLTIFGMRRTKKRRRRTRRRIITDEKNTSTTTKTTYHQRRRRIIQRRRTPILAACIGNRILQDIQSTFSEGESKE